MYIDRVSAVYFSPGGTTRLCARETAGALGSFDEYDFTASGAAVRFGGGDAAVFAAPVFGGRIPAPFAESLARLEGGGAAAVVIAVYGARDYDDALLELADAVSARGFRVVAAGAFVARHSMVPQIAAGRPDGDDRAALRRLGELAGAKIEAGDFTAPDIPGARPYRAYGGVPLHPAANRARCVKCGKCARECPVGAISADAPHKTDNARCITCMHCVYACPNYARALSPVLLAAARTKLKKSCDAGRRPELFL